MNLRKSFSLSLAGLMASAFVASTSFVVPVYAAGDSDPVPKTVKKKVVKKTTTKA